MAKVRCRFCKFEQDRLCSAKKNITIKVNKKRNCSDYEAAEGKIVEFLDNRQSDAYPRAIMRPDWWWDRDKRRAERDKLMRKEAEQHHAAVTPSKDHPLTGDLSRFISSATQNGSQNENDSDK